LGGGITLPTNLKKKREGRGENVPVVAEFSWGGQRETKRTYQNSKEEKKKRKKKRKLIFLEEVRNGL